MHGMKQPRAQERATASSAVDSTPDSSIVWREDAGVYKPISRRLGEFLSEIELIPRPTQLIASGPSPLIFIQHSCVQDMELHARSDILNEQAGILCGQAYLDDSGVCYLAVSSALPIDVLNSPHHFSFHEKSWEAIWDRMDASSNIVGWYHSHPGLGVFLSETDLRTQSLHFNAGWQIAIVLDPVSKQRGIFQGVAGERVPAERVIRYSPQKPSPKNRSERNYRFRRGSMNES